MKTIFYKILYKNKDVVYVGVTTRTINSRFKEHIISKSLNLDNYSIVKFDEIEHPEIDNINIFYKERIKVAILERKYIQEEKDKGSILLNISKGGEWGTNILNKLRKDNFFNKFNSYDGYKEYKIKKYKLHCWLRHFIECRSRNKHKQWLLSWINNKNKNKLKNFLYYWIKNKGNSKSKVWITSWLHNRSYNKTKRWLQNWKNHRENNETKIWLQNWIRIRTRNKIKIWLQSWTYNKNIRRINCG